MLRLSRKIFLASKSPRRHALLKRFGIPFVALDRAPEEPDLHLSDPVQTAGHLARVKAEHAAANIAEGIILGFDTIVWCSGKILGKPKDRDEARDMLLLLSGNAHKVYTGMAALLKPEAEVEVFCETSTVSFRKLEDPEIINYINTGEPFDKAGGYGIQGAAGAFVSRIQGCYFNIVGLPVKLLMDYLKPHIIWQT